jgi:hypothetical protein
MKPSEFYKSLRPEYFSDSELSYDIELPREILAYELEQISTNQKQDEFETLCRRLAEKSISPNLIPQVGPTGGGDGKTDFETHPVSKEISDRWFIPENGWDKGEKWGFAISAKKEWKSKAKSDIKKIIGTERDYTKIYFMTNQKISSKRKKDAQDEFAKEFSIDVIILDGEWILEKIYNNDLVELVVDSINLSSTFKNKTIKQGSNDISRIKELKELEEKINNQNRYSRFDFQLVQDALRAAILSRMLEKPRDEVEGKFQRAFRFCKKDDFKNLIQIYYQRAWTYLYWYDDYEKFVDDYLKVKKLVSNKSSAYEIELYFNLFNSLYAISVNPDIASDLDINIEHESKDILVLLKMLEEDKERLNLSLTAQTYRLLINIIKSIHNNFEDIKELFEELTGVILKCNIYPLFPFESTKKIIEKMGDIFANSKEYDLLFEKLVEINEKRSSELNTGNLYLRRAVQKFEAKLYEDSIIYFGKSLLKLSKEEAQHGVYLALIGLAYSYKYIGLMWASNNCFISAYCISLKTLEEKGIINKKSFNIAKEILENEIIIGRIPQILIWWEIVWLLRSALNITKDLDSSPQLDYMTLTESILSVRLVNSNVQNNENYTLLPDILNKYNLEISADALLFKLGQFEIIKDDYKNMRLVAKEDFKTYFTAVANQPAREQLLYDTNLMSGDLLELESNVLGCNIIVSFKKNKELLLIAETILALIESFLSTSFGNAASHKNFALINLEFKEMEKILEFTYDENLDQYSLFFSNEELLTFNNTNSNTFHDEIIVFIATFIAKNFFIKGEIKDYLLHLFEEEEVIERMSVVYNHRNFFTNSVGTNAKVFFEDWIKGIQNLNKYEIKEVETFPIKKEIAKENFSFQEKRHDKIRTESVIDVELWNKAGWTATGFIFEPFFKLLGLVFVYQDINAGEKIFDNWIKRFGRVDEKELIKISIIKGIDKNNPCCYAVQISSKPNMDFHRTNLLIITSRHNIMTPDNLSNLDSFEKLYNQVKNFTIMPAKFDMNKQLEPIFDKAITKIEISIKNAWEIGENDIERCVMDQAKNPIIPQEHIKDAPILKWYKK